MNPDWTRLRLRFAIWQNDGYIGNIDGEFAQILTDGRDIDGCPYHLELAKFLAAAPVLLDKLQDLIAHAARACSLQPENLPDATKNAMGELFMAMLAAGDFIEYRLKQKPRWLDGPFSPKPEQ
jgi:hypothetical protein